MKQCSWNWQSFTNIVHEIGFLMVACSRPSGCSKSCDLWPAFAPCNTWSSRHTALRRVGDNGQSGGSTVSDAIVSFWMWSAELGIGLFL